MQAPDNANADCSGLRIRGGHLSDAIKNSAWRNGAVIRLDRIGPPQASHVQAFFFLDLVLKGASKGDET